MAFTVNKIDETVFGNKRVQMYLVTADGATGTIPTGLSFVDCIATAYKSMTSGAGQFAANEGSAGTSIVGTVGVAGVANGDEFYLTVYGR